MSKLVPKIILEGTLLTFKTDIAFALNEHPRIVGPRRYRYHSPLSPITTFPARSSKSPIGWNPPAGCG